jgi:hemolysin activation/secretion protein
MRAFALGISLLIPCAAGAATTDRSTIPLTGETASAAFSRPLPPERPPILPAYSFTPPISGVSTRSTERYRVSRIDVTGSSVLGQAGIDNLVARYEQRDLSFSDMVALRDELTGQYLAAGYVTSGATLLNLEDEVLTLEVIEGHLAEIQVNSDGHFRPAYVEDYLAGFGEAAPVNVFELEERLQIFQQQPHVDVVEAELLPGSQRGESILWVDPVETNRWAWGLEASNQLSPAIGGVQAVASVQALNLTGRADDLRLGLRGAEGLLELMGEYDFPLGTRGRRLAVYAFGADSDIVRGPFDHLDIGADSMTAGLRLRQPLQRSLQQHTNLSLAAEWRQSQTYLLGQGFSFVEGPDEGEARMTILRLGVDSLRRTERDVIYGRAELSGGLDALDPTLNPDSSVPDGRFVKFRVQFQWARRFAWLDSQTLVRLDAQISNDPLFGLEQFPVGGRWTVRGYRENTLIRDNAVIASAEWRLPLRQSSSGRSLLELRPFADWSNSSNVNGQEIGPRTLASLGLGVYWSPVEDIQMEVYWGAALNDVEYAGEYDIQDDGIHFRFNWDAIR